MDFLILFLGLLGVVTHSINIRVFAYQGLSSDSNTVGLFSLVVADLFGSFFLMPHMSLCKTMGFAGATVMAANCYVLTLMVSGSSHLVMARLASWLTVYIAVERCLCVWMPFKLKTLFRPLALSYIPVVTSMRVKWMYSPDLNTTMAVNTDFSTGYVFLKYASLTFNVILPLAAFIFVSIATGLMLYKLNHFKNWRQRTVSVGNRDNTEKGDNSFFRKPQAGQGKKDIEVLKTTLVVTSVFLVCLSASLIPGMTTALLPFFFLYWGQQKYLPRILLL